MLKVAVIGPESTGKTELCRKLAVHFHGEWVPELARDYVEQMEYHYTCGDVWRIARLQIEQEKKYERKTKPDYVFFDTDLILVFRILHIGDILFLHLDDVFLNV